MRLSAAGRRRDGGGSAPAVQSAGAGARLLHLAPGVLRGRRPGGLGGPRRAPRTAAGSKVWRGPRSGGPGQPGLRGGAGGVAAPAPGPPQPGRRSCVCVCVSPAPVAAAMHRGRPPGFQVGGREEKKSWQAVGETQPNFNLRHPVLMPKLRTSLATLPVPEDEEGESRN